MALLYQRGDDSFDAAARGAGKFVGIGLQRGLQRLLRAGGAGQGDKGQRQKGQRAEYQSAKGHFRSSFRQDESGRAGLGRAPDMA